MTSMIDLAECGWLPDVAIRYGIRRLLGQRLRDERTADPDAARRRTEAFIDTLRSGPVALVPEAANAQHYEVPAEFFAAMLGPRRKYSSCLFPAGVADLQTAEDAMLKLTCERAELADGQAILELGCGWGSLSLWMAERYPRARILGVSNSHSQRESIMERAARRGLTNLEIVTADMNDFASERRFDRVVSVEMFEHMHNYAELLRRVSTWLTPAGKLFVHIFVHRNACYPFAVDGNDDWMAKHFFSGGLMPSEDLLLHFPDHLHVERRWAVDGTHYARTLELWLNNLDAREPELCRIMQATYGDAPGPIMLRRWRIFLMACAELFNYRGGREWFVGHTLLKRA